MAEETVTQQIVREAPEIEAYKLKLLQEAQKLAFNQTPGSQTLAQQLPSYQVAGFSPAQAAAMKAAETQGIGAFTPYMTAANTALSDAYKTTGEAADVLRGADTRNQFTDAQKALSQAGGATANIASGIGQINTGLGYTDLAAQATAASDTSGQFGQGVDAAYTAAMQARLAAAQPGFNQAQRTIQQGLGQLGGATQGYDPASAQAFMDPYRQQVIDETMRQMDRQGAIAGQGLAAQAVKSGAFGGEREGVQRAEMQRNIMDQKSAAIANLLSQGYSQAQAAAMATFEQQQQRQAQAGQGIGQLGTQQAGIAAQQAGLGQNAAQQLGQAAQLQTQAAGQQAGISQNQANLYLQNAQAQNQAAQTAAGIYGQQAQQYQGLGQGIGQLAGQQFGIGQATAQGLGQLGGQLGQLGVQQGALGQTAQALQQGDINFLYNTGQAGQAFNQQTLDAQRANELQKVYAPYQQAGFLSDIYKGAPSSQMSTQVASQPSASPFQQAVGIGLGAVSTAAGAKKAGLF